MTKKFNEGDTVYFISNGIFVREAKVVRCAGGFVTIKFDTSNTNEGPAGTRVRESKVYASIEEAEVVAKAHLNQHELD